MKAIKFFALMLLAGSVLFTSCGEDDPEDEDLDPTISFLGGSGYTDEAAELEVSAGFLTGITASKGPDANKGLVGFTVTRTFNNSPTTVLDTTFDESDSFTWEDSLFANAAEGVEKWVFEITDDDGATASIEFDITTSITNTDTPLGAYSADVYLASQSWATYSGNATTTGDATIGLEMTGSAASGNTIGTTTAAGIVEVDNTITTYEALTAAYDGGTAVQTLELAVDDQGKAFAEKYLAVKVSTTYYLVHYKAGVRNTTTGNVVVLEYKTSS